MIGKMADSAIIQKPKLKIGGARRVRTDDPLLAKQVLYQLSYDPKLGGSDVIKNDILSKFTLCDQSRPRQLASTLSSKSDCPSTIGFKSPKALSPSP